MSVTVYNDCSKKMVCGINWNGGKIAIVSYNSILCMLQLLSSENIPVLES